MRQLILFVLLALAACKDNRPAAPTPDQSRQLNEAENMLDNMAANEEGPAQSPGPSNTTN